LSGTKQIIEKFQIVITLLKILLLILFGILKVLFWGYRAKVIQKKKNHEIDKSVRIVGN